MAEPALKPLVEIPQALDSGGRSTEERQIGRLVSGNAFARARASQWLRDHGDSRTALRLEPLATREDIPKEARRDVGLVLQHLSWKHMDFSNTPQGHVARMTALAAALSVRSRSLARLQLRY